VEIKKPPQVSVDLKPVKVAKTPKTPKIKQPKERAAIETAASVDISADEDILNGPEIKGFLKGLGGKIKTCDIQAPEVHTKKPDFDITLANVDVDLTVPKVEIPSVDSADVKIKPPKIKPPKVKPPKAHIELPSVTTVDQTVPPELDLESADVRGGIKGFFKGIGGKIKAPDVHVPELQAAKEPPTTTIDIHLPDLHHQTDFSLPNVDVEVVKPSLNIESSLNAEDRPRFTAPDIEIEQPELGDIDSPPDMKGGIKNFFKGIGGKIKSPDVQHVSDLCGVKRPTDVHIDLPPHVDVDVPADVSIKSPKIKPPPKVDVFDIKPPKVKPPKVELPKLEAPAVDVGLNLPALDVDVAEEPAADMKGGIKNFFKGIGGKIKAPEVHVPLPDLCSPSRDPPTHVDLELPSIQIKQPDVELPSVDIKTPTHKRPKVKEPSLPPVAKVDVDDVNLNKPDIELLDLPDYQLELDDGADMKGGLKDFFKGIGCKIKAPDVHVPDLSVNRPDVDWNIPSKDIDFNVPPSVDIKSPKIKPGKVEIPAYNIEIQKPQFEIPEADFADVLSGPEMKGFFKGIGGKIKAPDVHLPDLSCSKQQPDIELNLPEIKSPKTPKAPKIKPPKVEVAKVEVPAIDLSIDQPELDLNAPELKGGITGFFKGIGGKIKAPEITVPEVQLPKVNILPDLSLPNVQDTHKPEVEEVEIDLRFDTPNVHLPDYEVEIDSPELKGGLKDFFKGIGGKIKAPDVHLPDLALKKPSVELPALPTVDVNVKKSSKVKIPKVDSRDLSIESPKIDVSLQEPEGDIKALIKGNFEFFLDVNF
jgi:hypothetical protein